MKFIAKQLSNRKMNFLRRGFDVNPNRHNDGFSLAELLIVIGIMMVIISLTLFSYGAHRKAYRTDDEALLILDYIRDAGRRSLAQRRPHRVEVDTTDNVVRLIADNFTDVSGANLPAAVLREDLLQPTLNVRYDSKPSGFNSSPPAPYNYSTATFATTSYAATALPGRPFSSSRTAFTLRFRSNGAVWGTTDTPASATLYIWTPSATNSAATDDQDRLRAITIFGGSGSIKLWSYNSGSSSFVSR